MQQVNERTVTLTFNLVIWLLIATHRIIMIIICAMLVSNPTMDVGHEQVSLKSMHKASV